MLTAIASDTPTAFAIVLHRHLAVLSFATLEWVRLRQEIKGLRRFHLPGVVSVSNGPPFGSLPISHVFCLDHDSLACKNAPMRAIAARASGRMRANICQTWNMRGHTWSSTSQPIARWRSAIRTASSRSASSLPT